MRASHLNGLQRSFLFGLFLFTACQAPDPIPPPIERSIIRPEEPEPTRAIILGESNQGHAIQVQTLGTGSTRIYLIGGIHGDEGEGRDALPKLTTELETYTEEFDLELRVVPDMNPDGSLAGTRGNAKGVDLNRNWPAHNFQGSSRNGPEPLSEPEANCVWKDLIEFQPHVVVVLHSSWRGPFVNFDGPAVKLAEAFAAGASDAFQPWRVVENMGYPTPGSLGTLIGLDYRVPILTVEFKKGQSASTAHSALKNGLERLFDFLHHSAYLSQFLPSDWPSLPNQP